MGESEFGKGLVICLVKFAEHWRGWREQKELWKKKKIGKLVKKLQDKGLGMGHGFTGKTWTEDDITKVYELTQIRN